MNMLKRATVAAMAAALLLGGCGNTDESEVSSLRRLPLGSSGDAAGSARATADASQEMSLAYPQFDVEYRVVGDLPALDGEAPAYELAAKAADDRVERLRKALGISTGDERLQVDAFSGGGSFFYDDGSRGGVASSSAISACAPCPPDAEVCTQECKPIEPEPPKDLPPKADAERLAREFWQRAGIEVGDVQVDENVNDGWRVSFVTEIDDVPVLGLEQSVTIGSKGAVRYANGFLAEAKKIGDYPLAGTTAGLKRLREGFGFGPRPLGGAEPAIADDMPTRVDEGGEAGGGSGGQTAPGYPGCTPEECPPTELPVPVPPAEPTVMTITGVDVVLMPVYPGCGGKPLVLVPAYRFALGDAGFTAPVAAVTDEHLEQSASDAATVDCPQPPMGKPEPGKVEPAVEPDAPVSDGPSDTPRGSAR